jgi:hypothetical protein
MTDIGTTIPYRIGYDGFGDLDIQFTFFNVCIEEIDIIFFAFGPSLVNFTEEGDVHWIYADVKGAIK